MTKLSSDRTFWRFVHSVTFGAVAWLGLLVIFGVILGMHGWSIIPAGIVLWRLGAMNGRMHRRMDEAPK